MPPSLCPSIAPPLPPHHRSAGLSKSKAHRTSSNSDPPLSRTGSQRKGQAPHVPVAPPADMTPSTNADGTAAPRDGRLDKEAMAYLLDLPQVLPDLGDSPSGGIGTTPSLPPPQRVDDPPSHPQVEDSLLKRRTHAYTHKYLRHPPSALMAHPPSISGLGPHSVTKGRTVGAQDTARAIL